MPKSTHFSAMLHNNSSTFAILACNAYDSNVHQSLKATPTRFCLVHNKAIYMIFTRGGVVIEKNTGE